MRPSRNTRGLAHQDDRAGQLTKRRLAENVLQARRDQEREDSQPYESTKVGAVPNDNFEGRPAIALPLNIERIQIFLRQGGYRWATADPRRKRWHAMLGSNLPD